MYGSYWTWGIFFHVMLVFQGCSIYNKESITNMALGNHLTNVAFRHFTILCSVVIFLPHTSWGFHINLKIFTPPETNIAPEKWWLEYCFPFGKAFSGAMLVSGSVLLKHLVCFFLCSFPPFSNISSMKSRTSWLKKEQATNKNPPPRKTRGHHPGGSGLSQKDLDSPLGRVLVVRR